MANEMIVEVNPTCTRTEEDDTMVLGGHKFLHTPPISPGYWLLRVKLSAVQALLVFPKFGGLGCGFAREEASWNTNLPLACPAQSVYDHIAINKGADIPAETCLAAIRALQEYALKAGLLTAADFEKMRAIDLEVKAALKKVGL